MREPHAQPMTPWMRCPRRFLIAVAACLATLIGPAVTARGDSPGQPVPPGATEDGTAFPQIALYQPLDSLASSASTSGSDGAWSAYPPPPAWFSIPLWRQSSAVVYDTDRERMVMVGGGGTSLLNDVWALTPHGTTYWEPLLPAGIAPAPRRLHAAAYDSLRQRIIVFGGYDGGLFNDLWELPLTGPLEWRRIEPSGPLPSARADVAMIYDPVADRVVIFGGYDGTSLPAYRRNDVWQLSLAGTPSWSEITPPTGPRARSGQRAIYDPVRHQMIAFGGYDGAYLNDVWALSLSGPAEWTQIHPVGSLPPPREGQSWVYDSARDRAVLFGGVQGGTYYSDTWELALGSNLWRRLTLFNAPLPRSGQAMVYDPAADRLALFSGFAYAGHVTDTWSVAMSDSSTWQRIAIPTSPGLRSRHSAIVDTKRNRMVIFSGTDGTDIYRSDTWELPLDANAGWAPLTPVGFVPFGRILHGAIYDPVGDRMIVFGGFSPIAGLPNDVLIMSFTGGPRWESVRPVGTAPLGRMAFAMAYDSVARRAIIFGGDRNGGNNQVWALNLGDPLSWENLTPADGPSPRWGCKAIYDSRRNRMVLFGGYSVSELNEVSYFNDVWSLSLTGTPQWTQVVTQGTAPSPRWEYSGVYDADGDRMLVFGGTDASGVLTGILNDLWSLSLDDHAWVELQPDGVLPAHRFRHAAIFDALRSQMIVHGGERANPFGLYHDAFAYAPDRPATVPIALTLPGTLNLRSLGRWVTAYLQPPAGLDAGQIDVSSIRLHGNVAGAAPVPVDPTAPTAVGDQNGDQVADLMVKFDRSLVDLTLSDGAAVTVTVTGTVAGQPFLGSTALRVLRVPITAPTAGSVVNAGAVTTVRWQTPVGVDVQSAALLSSVDDGASWTLEANGIPNTGSYDWAVPINVSAQARVALVLVETADTTGYVVNGVLGVSEAFIIEGTVGVRDHEPAQLAMRGAAPNPAPGGRLLVEFSLRDGSPATLEVTDVAGRVLTSRQVGALGPGSHALDVSGGGSLRPGIYFMRLRQGGGEVLARAAVIR